MGTEGGVITPLLQRYLLDNLLINRVHHIEALELCSLMPDQSVDMLLCDLPYGTTACSWDTVIPFDLMWASFKRVIKPHGAIVLTACQPFTSALVMSNPAMFKYSWVWDKVAPTGFLSAQMQPMRRLEDVLVFSLGGANNGTTLPMNYFPQGLRQVNAKKTNGATAGGLTIRDGGRVTENNTLNRNKNYVQEFEGYPSNLLIFSRDADKLHPTQKPVALFEYLIKTYTKEDDLVFDPTSGVGTTGVAARNTKRRFVCGDLNLDYVLTARDRLRLPFEKRHTPVNDDVSGLPLFAAA